MTTTQRVAWVYSVKIAWVPRPLGYKGCVLLPKRKNPLERRYGLGHLHFITCSCYQRLPFFASERRRDIFLRILREVRDRYDFAC